MLLFCPHCSSILRIDTNPKSGTETTRAWICRNCPYMCPIEPGKPFYQVTKHALKQKDTVMGGADMFEGAPKTDINCPDMACGGVEAMFYQRQIRSADEPMTMFYKCVACLREWREG